MSQQEGEIFAELAHHQSVENEPLAPTQLPTDLAQFLQSQHYACLTHATDQGVVLVLKATAADIESARGTVPIGLRHELYEHPLAPVVRMVTTIYDQPRNPLRMETFINIGDPNQRADYEALGNQEQLHLLFFDEDLAHRLTKQVGGVDRDAARLVLAQADALATKINPDSWDFDQAKAVVMAATKL